jgi:PAS domain S-box-containing protein
MLQSLIQDSSLISVYESSPDGILIVDENFVIVFHNARFGEIWRLPDDSLHGNTSNSASGHDYTPIFTLLTERVTDKAAYVEKVKWLYAHPEVDDKSEIELIDGRTIERYTSGVFIQGQAHGRIWFFRDITARKNVEKELFLHKTYLEHLVNERTMDLYKAKQVAEDANRVKSQFLSAMSSALRTPLNAIIGFSQLLKNDVDSPLNDDQKESVDYILSSGEHLQFLINQLLDLSHLKDGQTAIAIESVSILELVQEVTFLITSMNADMHDSTHINQTETLVVHANRAKLKQVLINVIKNALLSEDDNNKVVIDWQILEAHRAKISVSDMNIAAVAENQVRLTSLFDEHGYDTIDSEGTEIGLLVSQELVDLMGGEFGFSCDDQTGTTFWLTLQT